MNDKDLAKMSPDELWALFEEVRAILSRKLGAQMHELQRRLAKINGHDKINGHNKIINGHDKINGHDDKPGNGTKAHRRPYPKVYPKYQILISPLRLGLDVACNRTGYVHSYAQGRGSTTC